MHLSTMNNRSRVVISSRIALIVYLAHIGSFVPAEAAVLGPTDAIYTLTSSGTSSTGRSALQDGFNLASMAIRNVTKQTLILFDEFAQSMDQVTAITVAIVEHLLEENECPHVIICTHNFEILDLLQERHEVQFVVSDY
ncbi:unnamed protein product [Echinostoma caproni]|uniref:DNA_MISMATCH_REPAIR_2 domain-containing protein n=1 Tax=Echinostoma caproni TaxID=27848 RepID=A0A183AZI2_9TREM|nr:unnamed protein product [Echinostoma caproni]